MTQPRRGLTVSMLLISVLALHCAMGALAGASSGTQSAPCEIKTTDQTVRVGLTRTFRGVKQITVLASSDYTIVRAGTNEKLASCTNLEPITLTAGQTQLSLKLVKGCSSDVGTSITITPNDNAGMVSIDSPGKPSKQYRGTIEVSLKSGCLQLVSIISIEDYLPGVVTGEMPSSYPDEALKAQAVAARTYTLCTLHRHVSTGYDLCDDAHCQVYDGVLREKLNTARAVLATRGQVLTYKGRLASVMYCADCGGVTECYAEAHDGVIPYLPSVIEPTGVTHRSWEKSYKLAELSAKLVAAGIKEGEGLKAICITKASSSGRALAFEITGPAGKVSVSGLKLRSALGRDGIRSTLCTIDATTDGVITFKGKGWGHGIGLCQVGAGALASPPYSYNYGQILAHYYPGTALSPIPMPAGEIKTSDDTQPKEQHSISRQSKAPKKHSTGGLQVRVEAPKL